MAKRTIRGQGFSLYGLQAEISQAVDLLAEALDRQGVAVNTDALLLQIQGVVKSVGDGVPVPVDNYGYMHASEESTPYSVAGDLLAIAYEQFKGGDKRTSIKTLIAAMGYEDFSDITTGILAMNATSSEQDNKSEDDTDESEDEDLNDEDIEDDDENEDEDLTDDDIDDLLEDSDNNIEADDEVKEDENDEEEEENKTEEPKDEKPEPAKQEKPNDKKPMTEEKPITASVNQKAISNKLSMSGDRIGRSKGLEYLNSVVKHKRVA